MIKKTTLMKRRTVGIVIAVAAVVILAVTLAVVMSVVRTKAVTDPADGEVYYIRYTDKTYSLYDSDKKTPVPTEDAYGYYVLDSGTLLELDAETGAYETIIVDTTVTDTEELGFNFRKLIFPHVEKAKIRRLDVYNSKGSFTFYRYDLEKGKASDSGDFVIKGSPLTSYDQELFASLYVSAGYTLTTKKIADPIKDENGEFSEYGLVAETRPAYDETTGEPIIDEATGEQKTYEYEPAYYVLTDTSGNKHKVIIGDLMVTGAGYYVQYVDVSGETEVKRDAVYVLGADIGDTMLSAIEDFVTPSLSYPMAMNNYFDVEKFYVLRKNGDAENHDELYEPIVGFDYIDLSERENTIKASEPYVFSGYTLDGFIPSSDNIDACLQSFYSPSFAGVVKLSPNGKDLYEYGLAIESGTDDKGNTEYELASEYIVSFNFDITDDSGKKVETINEVIYFSEPNKSGNRYAFTEIYTVDENGDPDDLLYTLDMIVEAQAHTVEFLNWDSFDWVNDGYINLNIAFCDKITLVSPDYSAEFELDNSASDSSENISSTALVVKAKDSRGNSRTTFSTLEVTDKDGNLWVITASAINCYAPSGKELKITSAYYDYNALDSQTRVVSGYIEANDGSKVYVTADEVKVVPLSGETVTYVRYDTNLFRQFYKTLLYASLANSYELTEEEKEALKNDESRKLLTMTVTDTDGVTKTYTYYSLTSRKAYITVNGNGGFYVMTNRVNKFITDAQKFFANEMIDSTAKN